MLALDTTQCAAMFETDSILDLPVLLRAFPVNIELACCLGKLPHGGATGAYFVYICRRLPDQRWRHVLHKFPAEEEWKRMSKADNQPISLKVNKEFRMHADDDMKTSK